MKIGFIFCSLLFIASLSNPASAQFGLGIGGGGNLAHGNGPAFSSSKRIGYQFGVDLSYSFIKNFSLQVEPFYNFARLRNHAYRTEHAEGIANDTRGLRYISLPVYLKLNITRGLALLGGADFNRLLNEDAHRLTNGNPAFRKQSAIGYSVGLDLGKLYFRYRNFGKNNNIVENWDSHIQQYQLGFKWRII